MYKNHETAFNNDIKIKNFDFIYGNNLNLFERIKETKTIEEDYELLFNSLCYMNLFLPKEKKELVKLCGIENVENYESQRDLFEAICFEFYIKYVKNSDFYNYVLNKAIHTKNMMQKWILYVFLGYMKIKGKKEWTDLFDIQNDIREYILNNKELPYLFLKNQKISEFLLSVIEKIEDLTDMDENKIYCFYKAYSYSCDLNKELYDNKMMYDLFNNFNVVIDVHTLKYLSNIAKQISDSKKIMKIIEKSFENKEYIMCEHYIRFLKDSPYCLSEKDRERLKKIYNEIQNESIKNLIFVDDTKINLEDYLKDGIDIINNLKFDDIYSLIEFIIGSIVNIINKKETSVLSSLLGQYIIIQGRKTNLDRKGTKYGVLTSIFNAIYNNFVNNKFYLEIFDAYRKEVNEELLVHFEYIIYVLKTTLCLSYSNIEEIDEYNFRFDTFALNLLYVVEPLIRNFLCKVDNKNIKITNSKINQVEMIGQTFPKLKEYTILSEDVWEYLKDRLVGINEEMVKSEENDKTYEIEGFRNHYMHGLSFTSGSPYLPTIFILVIVLFFDLNESLTQIKLKSNNKLCK